MVEQHLGSGPGQNMESPRCRAVIGRIMRPRARLVSGKFSEVSIDHAGMSGHHPVRETGVDLERATLEQLRLQQ
jgi:hypothetical protein